MTAELAERRRLAIGYAKRQRETELEPIRARVALTIRRVGWQRARPVVEAVMGYPVPRSNGRWWRAVGKRRAAALLSLLDGMTQQEILPIEVPPR
jgi:hypothetical protein